MFLRSALLMCQVGMGLGVAPEPADKRAEIRLAESRPADELIEAEIVGTDKKIYLHPTAVATSKDIAEARVTTDTQDKPAITVTFTEDGSKKIGNASGNHIGKRLAILVDGKVICAPTIRQRISKKAVISGDFSEREAARIAKAFNAD